MSPSAKQTRRCVGRKRAMQSDSIPVFFCGRASILCAAIPVSRSWFVAWVCPPPDLRYSFPGARAVIGETVSHYKILDKLGEGGMGAVYRAEDLILHREVALKFLPPRLAADPEARARLLKEAQTASRLNHPNIATIYELSLDGPFIAMELVAGQTVKAMLAQ